MKLSHSFACVRDHPNTLDCGYEYSTVIWYRNMCQARESNGGCCVACAAFATATPLCPRRMVFPVDTAVELYYTEVRLSASKLQHAEQHSLFMKFRRKSKGSDSPCPLELLPNTDLTTLRRQVWHHGMLVCLSFLHCTTLHRTALHRPVLCISRLLAAG